MQWRLCPLCRSRRVASGHPLRLYPQLVTVLVRCLLCSSAESDPHLREGTLLRRAILPGGRGAPPPKPRVPPAEKPHRGAPSRYARTRTPRGRRPPRSPRRPRRPRPRERQAKPQLARCVGGAMRARRPRGKSSRRGPQRKEIFKIVTTAGIKNSCQDQNTLNPKRQNPKSVTPPGIKKY